MKTGTKSVLFGVHQFLWHPFTVWLAWIALYKKLPSFWQTVAIVVHDWGYVGCEKMDDANGEQHPFFGAQLAARLRLWAGGTAQQMDALYCLTLFHSRYLSAAHNAKPSKLCWADKYCMKFDPAWFYLLRARLSGELAEYRANATDKIANCKTDREWYVWIKAKCIRHALQQEPASHRNHRNHCASV